MFSLKKGKQIVLKSSESYAKKILHRLFLRGSTDRYPGYLKSSETCAKKILPMALFEGGGMGSADRYLEQRPSKLHLMSAFNPYFL